MAVWQHAGMHSAASRSFSRVIQTCSSRQSLQILLRTLRVCNLTPDAVAWHHRFAGCH